MTDENDLRPLKLPFPGLFLRCGEQQARYPIRVAGRTHRVAGRLRCGEQQVPTQIGLQASHVAILTTAILTTYQVHYLELPNPDPDTAAARPEHGRDRRTAYSVSN